MSTGQYQGYSVDKPTSKVMAPPGGRSSNIFGTYEEEKKPVSTNGAATVTPTATNGTNSNGTNGSTANNGVSPNPHQAQIDAAANKKQQTAGNNLFGANENTNPNVNRKKRTGYNPITGESYDDEPTPAAAPHSTPTAPSQNTTPQAQPPQSDATPTEGKPVHTSVSVKQPPGGRSTKLW